MLHADAKINMESVMKKKMLHANAMINIKSGVSRPPSALIKMEIRVNIGLSPKPVMSLIEMGSATEY
jgi:hypothetical protein